MARAASQSIFASFLYSFFVGSTSARVWTIFSPFFSPFFLPWSPDPGGIDRCSSLRAVKLDWNVDLPLSVSPGLDRLDRVKLRGKGEKVMVATGHHCAVFYAVDIELELNWTGPDWTEMRQLTAAEWVNRGRGKNKLESVSPSQSQRRGPLPIPSHSTVSPPPSVFPLSLIFFVYSFNHQQFYRYPHQQQ